MHKTHQRIKEVNVVKQIKHKVINLFWDNLSFKICPLSLFEGISAGTILYVVVFEILQREKNKSVPGLLQLTFLLIGFAVMVCIEIFGKSFTET
jgi:hypothetical protein